MEFVKKHWPKATLVLALLIACFVVYEVKDVEYIELYIGALEEGDLLEEGKIKNLHYRDGELLDITAIYKEAVSNPEGYEVNVEMIGEVDMMTLGEYPVVYRAEHNGAVTEVHMTYIVKDVKAPVITLEGGEEYVMQAGSEYEEPGYTATDIHDGDITDQVVVTGEPNPYTDFVLTYTVTDSSGNVAEVQRTVNVEVGEDQRVVYLTFDDGPSAYTERLLDVLDAYNVKATFFVTGQNLDYVDMIGEAYRRGHTIALHTYSHDYSIYSSAEDYYEDLQKIQDIVVEQTGQEATIVRFPGGTANTTSRKYCEGIMSFLKDDLENHGYIYCDWNVSSGDGGGAHDEATVINNVTSTLGGYRKAVVLQHDTQGFSVDAVDDIIQFARSKGYILLPLTETSPMVQHGANN